jgi:two-component system, sensor histidine kinase PdtaS
MLFIVLSCALAPLGAIAVAAGVRTILASERERGALLQVSVSEQSGRLQRRFAADIQRLKAAAVASARPLVSTATGEIVVAETAVAEMARLFPQSGAPAVPAAATDTAAQLRRAAMQPMCVAADRAFPPQSDRRPFVQIIDERSGDNLCVGGIPAEPVVPAATTGRAYVDVNRSRIVVTAMQMADAAKVEIVYPLAALRPELALSPGLPPHRLTVASSTGSIILRGQARGLFPDFQLSREAAVGATGVMLGISAPRSWLGGAELVGLLTPISMWLLAAILSWLIIDRVLLAPIQRLSRQMRHYSPGDTLTAAAPGILAAREVVQLQGGLEQLAEDVATDKTALADGLDAQRALTREVHHRVKNNLQIIASMVNLHSRDADSADATLAYRTIQRRVEALGLVQRHLRAEREDAGNIALSTMIGELATALRHGLSQDFGAISITTSADPIHTTQDVAMPLAFFVTEVAEMAARIDPKQPVAIQLTRSPGTGNLAQLAVVSTALVGVASSSADRFANSHRIINAIARQLRQPLTIVAEHGWYGVQFEPSSPLPGEGEPLPPE